MTRQTSIPTKQQVDDTVQYVLEKFNDTELDNRSIIVNHPEWKLDSFYIKWQTKTEILLSDIEPNVDDLRSWKNKRGFDDKVKAVICFPKYKEFINSKDEEVTGVYYNAYPMYNLERYIDMLPEYTPKELPPLYELCKYNDISVIYGPEQRGLGGLMYNANKQMVLNHDIMDSFFHELAHYYDYRVHNFKSSQKRTQEIIAELTACTLSMIYGRDTTQKSMSYINHYMWQHTPKDISKRCRKVLKRITNVLHSIVDDAKKVHNQKNTK